MTGSARYLEIADYWRKKIFMEQLRAGDELPSRRELIEQHGASRATVDKAVAMLASEGLISSRQGERTVVIERPRVGRPTGASRVRRINLGGSNYANGETSRDHVAVVEPAPNEGVARNLGVSPSTPVVIRRRTFVQDGYPSVVAYSYLHPRVLEVVPEAANQGRLPTWWRQLYIERTGEKVFSSPELRGARAAYRNELELLEVRVDEDEVVPVLVLNTLFHDSQGPLEFWEDVYAPGLWQEGEVK